MVARVLEPGPGVTSVQPGDRVISATPHCQHFLLREAEAWRVPEGPSDIEAAWARLAATTQLGARRAEVQFGESVAVVGAGTLGQLVVVQYMALSGARRVIAIDLDERRVAVASAHGATHGITEDVAEVRPLVAELTEGRMLDVVFDVTGNPAVLASAVGLLRKFGRLVLLGDTPTPSQQPLGPGVVSNSLSILGIHGSGHPASWSEFAPWSRPEMYDLFFDYLRRGAMRVSDLVTHRFSPGQASEAYRLLQERPCPALGAVFEWDDAA
jgi:threonine dehydrogenase-like Zn-dependent dehydrogenase